MKKNNIKQEKVFDQKFIKILLIFIFIFFIIILVITPVVKYKPWYQWWNKYDPEKKYRCFPLSQIAFFESNTLLYLFSGLFVSPKSKFEHNWWIYFITGFMKGGAIEIVNNGWVTPKNLCESLIPDTAPNNTVAWPTSSDGWKNAIQKWGNIKWDDHHYTGDVNLWQSNPDNFLSKNWGIPYDSGLIIGFLTGFSTSPLPGNETLWPDLMEPLLGIKTGIASGGWFGFLQNNDNFAGRGLVEANRLIWANQRPPALVKKHQDKSKCNVGSVASGAVGTGLGGAFLGGMAAGAPFLLPGMLVGAVIGLFTGGIVSAVQQKCI